MTVTELNNFLKFLIDKQGSDLIVSAGKGIWGRINGKLYKFKTDKTYNRGDIIQILKEKILRSRFNELVEKKQLDFSYKLNEEYRFRGNVFFQLDGPSIVFRKIPNKIPELKELNLPKSIEKIVDFNKGLVLVTGITGSGKSTTLAALLNEINKRHNKHIITIEDPIEFIHKPIKSLIQQRNIGEDALDFYSALIGALREDPDIILLGELRDKENIETALHAAETGHLVFSTLHTLDAKETVNRILNTFPAQEQELIRTTLATTLKAVISQRLVPTIDNKRRAVVEILFNLPLVKKSILENRISAIPEILEKNHDIEGTQTFDQHLVELVVKGIIDEKTAEIYSSNVNNFKLKLKYELSKFNKNIINQVELDIKKDIE